MNTSRRAVTAVVSVALAMTGATAAHADSSTVLYVDSASTSCTDSGTGTQAAPFCTIQPAANAAVAGDTVDIEAGVYSSAVNVTSQGTAAAPIVFQSVGGLVSLEASLTFTGASYVTFEGGEGRPGSQEMALGSTTLNSSSHITLDRNELSTVDIAGTSTNATVSRDWVRGLVSVDAGSSGDVISTNWFEATQAAISVTAASNVAITSNTIEDVPENDDAVSISGASTGISFENNIVGNPATAAADSATEIVVDAAAAPGTTLDYNVVWPYPYAQVGSPEPQYLWAGTYYGSAATLYKATGQGQHDLDTNPHLDNPYQNPTPFWYAYPSPQENSANISAPGMLTTDMYGYPCSGNPLAAATSNDCSRGAAQPNYTTSVNAFGYQVDALSVSLGSNVTESIDDPGNPSSVSIQAPPVVSYLVNWGDGISKTYAGSTTDLTTHAPHTYAKAGTYTITDTAEFTNGTSSTTTTEFTTGGSGYTPYGPTRILDTRSGLGAPKAKVLTNEETAVQVAGVGSIPSNVTAVAVNLTVTDATGGGYIAVTPQGGFPSTSNVNYSKGQTVANSAIVPVTNGAIELFNAGGSGGSIDLIADVSGYFTPVTGDGYSAVTPDRILDTRSGTGAPKAKVGAGGHISVGITGIDSIPSDAKAVAVHVTMTNATGGGYIAAEPDGAGTPTTSTLNYLAGQTISNTVIVPVPADGKIELFNGALSGSVDLIADVSGYFSAESAAQYVPLVAFRAYDSRPLGGLNPETGYQLTLDDTNGPNAADLIPYGATVITNLTVTGAKAGGNLIAYPAGTAQPVVSDVNFQPGQTVANLGLLGTTGYEQSVNFFNQSPGSVDLILDVQGYFANS